MAEFNSIEKSLAYILSSTPRLKRRLKWLYQFANSVAFKKRRKLVCSYPVTPVSVQDIETFFGYYDKSPENADRRYTIFHSSYRSTRKLPSPTAPVSIVLKDNTNGRLRNIATSRAYNWQQGTKLHWISSDRFVLNTFDAERQIYCSVVYDTEGRERGRHPYPLYDTFSDEYGLTLNFKRLNALRPDYGYRCHTGSIDVWDKEADGVFFCDLKGGDPRLLISLEELADIRPLPSMKNARHKVNHIMISPNGERFMFIHRWIAKNGKRYDRLIVACRDGSRKTIVADNEMVSHCCWFDSDTIIGYLRHPSSGDSFYRIDLQSGATTLLSEALQHLGDGHPSFYKNKMVFDSYPDRSRMKRLYLYDLEEDQLEEIGQFFESLKFSEETRCDLHPRWGEGGRCVYIDSVHEGERSLYKVQLETGA